MPKMGQKIKDNPKDKTIQIRVDEKTLEKLDYVVSQKKESRSEVVREGIEMQYKKVKKETKRKEFNMTTEQLNYIESRIEEFYEKRRDEYESYIYDEVIDELELSMEKEEEKAEELLQGVELETYLSNFEKVKKSELEDYYWKEFEKEVAKEIEEYRKELIKEVLSEE